MTSWITSTEFGAGVVLVIATVGWAWWNTRRDDPADVARFVVWLVAVAAVNLAWWSDLSWPQDLIAAGLVVFVAWFAAALVVDGDGEGRDGRRRTRPDDDPTGEDATRDRSDPVLSGVAGRAGTSPRRLRGALYVVAGASGSAYLLLVAAGVAPTALALDGSLDAVAFPVAAGVVLAAVGGGHLAGLDETRQFALFAFGGGLLILFHTVVLAGAPFSTASDAAFGDLPPLYATLFGTGLAGYAIARTTVLETEQGRSPPEE